jgi:hypothetical protein
MSILDLHAEELVGVARNMPRVPAPRPTPRFSAWSAAPRGVAVGATETGGFFADVLGAFGQTLAATDARPGGMFSTAEAPDASQAREQVLQGVDFSSAAGDKLRGALTDWRPSEQDASTAERLIFDFSRFATKAVGYSLATGPVVGAALTGADEGLTAADALRQKGVDLETRTQVGAVAGVTAGASVALPVFGRTWAQTIGLVAAGGPGAFMAQQALTREILANADYSKLADQYDPLDPVGLAVSTLVPAGFGAWAMRGAARRASTVPRETEDAARVALHTEHQRTAGLADQNDPAAVQADIAVQQRAAEQINAGEPVNVADIAPAVDDMVMIGKRLEQQIARDFDGAVARYSERPDSQGGKVLNTDTARELSDDYLADRTLSAAVHEPASQFVKDLYARKLAEAPKEGELPIVLFTAGGTGAGKSTAVQNVASVSEIANSAQIVYDTNMNGFESAKQKIEQALEAGKSVRIVLVARDPEEALVNGALPRAERQRSEFGSGRTVPVAEHIRTHLGAIETVKRLAKEYAGDERVQVRVIDNSLGRGNAVERDTAWLDQLVYNDVEQRVTTALEREREAGRISEETYRGFAGRPAQAAARPGDAGQDRGIRPPDRAGDDAGPEQGRVEEVARGRSATVVTERGTDLPVHWAVVEAADLNTSHTNELRVNPEYPAELQPRDRSRAASEQQIASIENRLRPELLGESAKASDGAPIIGADGVVESGNARTIALRRAYDSGKAAAYRQWLDANAERFGIERAALAKAARPVLVRITEGRYDRAEFARQANESAVARMSASEQAKADAARLPDLESLNAGEDGAITAASSRGFIRAFIQKAVSPTERGEMMTADGELSQAGLQRVRNAVFAKAYGDSDIVGMLAESTDANVKNILAGMMRAAPKVAKLREMQDAGARQSVDIISPLVQGVRKFSQLRRDGMTVDQFKAQGSMFEADATPADVVTVLEGLASNAKAPKRVSESIESMVDTVDALGDPRQAGMFGDTDPDVARTMALDRARLLDVQDQFPDLMVRLTEDSEPMPLRQAMEIAERQAIDEASDAPLYPIAANCFLTNGTA